jgi:hypothetical protein
MAFAKKSEAPHDEGRPSDHHLLGERRTSPRGGRRTRRPYTCGATLTGRCYVMLWIFSTFVPPAPTGMPVVKAMRSPEETRPARTISRSVM